MRFKAAVLEKVGSPLVVREVTVAELKPSDVLVRNKASGLCHTDLEIIQGQLAWPLPAILGHEGAGIVEAIGSDVALVKSGDHVVCSWNPTGGHCFYCGRGQPILCEPHNRHNGQGALLDGGSRRALDGRANDLIQKVKDLTGGRHRLHALDRRRAGSRRVEAFAEAEIVVGVFGGEGHAGVALASADQLHVGLRTRTEPAIVHLEELALEVGDAGLPQVAQDLDILPGVVVAAAEVLVARR